MLCVTPRQVVLVAQFRPPGCVTNEETNKEENRGGSTRHVDAEAAPVTPVWMQAHTYTNCNQTNCGLARLVDAKAAAFEHRTELVRFCNHKPA